MVRRFIAFRVLFNARWYYPVMAVLFLDFGITLDQYALLNVLWAVSIVCLEVPSGALADRFGRKPMVVLAASLMIAEIALWAFAPIGSVWLFPMLCLNRILSGAAEACASGADESLAYESLRAGGLEHQWPAVLGRLMRWQSAGFFIAMLFGAAIYDPRALRWICSPFGLELTRETTLRWPLYLTLLNAVLALAATLGMHEPRSNRTDPSDPTDRSDLPGRSTRSNWAQTLHAGRWILASPLVLLALLWGLSIDSVIRLFLTIGSNYYRLIGIPEVFYGAIGSALAVLGFFIPRLAQQLVAERAMGANLRLTAGLAFAGLCGIALIRQPWGVLMVIPLGAAMSMLQFFMSHYLNVLIDDSSLRTTVLSFKGLAFNLAYGAVGLLFAGFTRARAGCGSQNAIFSEALLCLPVFFAAICVMLSRQKR